MECPELGLPSLRGYSTQDLLSQWGRGQRPGPAGCFGNQHIFPARDLQSVSPSSGCQAHHPHPLSPLRKRKSGAGSHREVERGRARHYSPCHDNTQHWASQPGWAASPLLPRAVLRASSHPSELQAASTRAEGLEGNALGFLSSMVEHWMRLWPQLPHSQL